MHTTSDVVIIGAGILGLTTAFKLLEKDLSLKITILEKEAEVASHQTGHNSGVIHSGIYYKPGSKKAENCVLGRKELLSYCNDNQVPYQKLSKLIVATELSELPFLDELYQRGVKNGVDAPEMISAKEAKDIEPNVSAIKAIHLPNAHIINYQKLSVHLKEQLLAKGVQIKLAHEVCAIGANQVITRLATFNYGRLINCAGLYSDRIAKMAGHQLQHQIIPFRGEYYFIKRPLVKGLIYPVPNPKFPFLGVHFTMMMDGRIEAGPNAVLSLKREGYKKSDISLYDTLDMAKFPGLWKMGKKHWKTGLFELQRSFSKQVFLKSLQKLVPSVVKDDLARGGAGVRAQIVDRKGQLADDFVIEKTSDQLHILNAPSPAATASFSIGKSIANLLFP